MNPTLYEDNAGQLYVIDANGKPHVDLEASGNTFALDCTEYATPSVGGCECRACSGELAEELGREYTTDDIAEWASPVAEWVNGRAVIIGDPGSAARSYLGIGKR